MTVQPPHDSKQQQTCERHHYDIPFASLFKRRPIYTCSRCGRKLKPVQAVEIMNLFLFYGLIIGVLLSPEFKEVFQGDLNQVLSRLGKFAIYFLVYLLLRFLLARFAPLKVVEEQKTAAELEAEAAARQAEREEEAERATEREALQAMYREYEQAAKADAQSDAAAEPTDRPTDEEAGALAPQETAEAPACEHRLKETWKNYIPGKQLFYCRTCGEPLKLSKTQNNLVMLAFLAAFILLLWRDLRDMKVGWGQYFAKVGLVILVVAIAQAIIIHTHPLDELTPTEMERFERIQAKRKARRERKK